MSKFRLKLNLQEVTESNEIIDLFVMMESCNTIEEIIQSSLIITGRAENFIKRRIMDGR